MNRSICILILDDDATMRALYSLAFRNVSVRLLMAEDEAEAEHLLETNTPDLLLADLCIGEKHGLDIAERVLQSVAKKIAIVVVTAETGNQLQGYIDSGRCLGVLLKPICLRSFSANVLRFIEILTGEIAPSPSHHAIVVRSESLGSAFLKTALAEAHSLSLRDDSDFFNDGSLAQLAHRWIGTSGIDCVPEVEAQARVLEKVALTKDLERIPAIRLLLADLVAKFEGALSSQHLYSETF